MNKLEQVITHKLKVLNKPIKHTGNGFILTSCLSPKHEDKKPSYSINLETGVGFCFTCKHKVNKDFWLSGLDDIETLEEIERGALYKSLERPTEVKQEFKEILLPPKTGEVRNKYRGISSSLYKELSCYVTKIGKYKGSIIFPIKFEGKFVGFESKNFKTSKYIHSWGFDAKSFIFGYEYLEKLGKNYVVIVEGIFDALSMLELGIPTICNWGVANNFGDRKLNQLIELGVETVYLSFDKDIAGQEAEKEIFKNIKLSANFKVKRGIMLKELQNYYKSSAKDFNEYLKDL